MDKLYPELVEGVTSIIARSRCHEEGFLQDPRLAAKEVLKYIHDKKLMVGEPENIEALDREY
ncbi:hypothetical protein [Segetibacter aerophilus]|uniref:Uncharacterized protein n=1 Tax=Segetibacter aerophilus TaxID=670293 RepID=A0A512B9Z5_9BACT|nr:hypothetical protein [Segetibacter aerophilus]GEO08763.1 hypothetical protein SAE01_12590 [Segetibacter aerophilus]